VHNSGLHCPRAGTVATGQGPLIQISTLKAITEVDGSAYACTSQGERLRAICRIIGDGKGGTSGTQGCRCEGDAYRTGGVGSEGGRTVVCLGEIAGVRPIDGNARNG